MKLKVYSFISTIVLLYSLVVVSIASAAIPTETDREGKRCNNS